MPNAVIILVLTACLGMAGCSGAPAVDPGFPVHTLYSGQYGEARQHVAAHLPDARDTSKGRVDRRYLLDRARLGVLLLADGYADSAVNVFMEVYELLRTQGLNEGKQVVAVAINEDLKVWKGEPFEQAFALAYTSMAHAASGSWDNARAAAGNALFYLRDFGYDEETKERLDQLALARAAAAHDQDEDAGVDLDHGYVVTESNFALGYLLRALANQQLDRPDEAADYFRRVRELAPQATDTIRRFEAGDYNTVLIVAYGLGPRKVGVGPGQAVAEFWPRTTSDDAALAVRVSDAPDAAWEHAHWVTDVNAMATDHMWNNLEDVRKAKATVGDTLLLLGAGTAVYGATRHDEKSTRDAALAIGGGMMLAGAVLHAGAHADLRYNDALAQRYYAVPLWVDTPDTPVTLEVDGRPASRVVLRGLVPPDSPGQRAVLRYVRLPSRPGNIPLPWATYGVITVGNPVTGPATDDPLPVILEGGNDAQLPGERALADYWAAGHLRDLTLAGLEDLYRQRGITWTIEDTGGVAGRHVLEGGTSLVSPQGGTSGFARLFCDPYRGVGPDATDPHGANAVAQRDDAPSPGEPAP